MQINTKAKILIWDIEVLPEIIWGYPTHRSNEAIKLKTIQDQTILSVSSVWFSDYQKKGDKAIAYKDVLNFDTNGMHDDYALCKYIWDLLDEADIVVHHYGDNFDVPKVMARFMFYGMGAPSSFETMDTKKLYSKIGLPSKKLNEIGRYLGVGEKDGSHGDLWFDMYNGCPKARDAMRKYNNKDVSLTAEILLKVLPYIKAPTSLNKYNGTGKACTCGSHNYQSRGVQATRNKFKKRYQCQDCGSWFASDKSFTTKEEAEQAPKGI